MRWFRGGGCTAAVALALAGPVIAQAPGQDTLGPRSKTAWQAPVASLVLPGSGQLLLGQDRGILYLAVEAFALFEFLRVSSVAGTEDDRFHDLAFQVARRPYAPQVRDTVFEYFEQMGRFEASGAYDLDPGPGFVPEPDAGTYNGAVWLLARRTYWTDPDVPPNPTSPEYQRAVQFYLERAVGDGYRWSWRNAPLEQEAYRRAILQSDAASREAQNYLGLLLANHALSAVDALVSSRLTRAIGRQARVTTRYGRGRGRLEVRIAL